MVRNFAIIAAIALIALLGVTWFLGRSAEDQFAQCRRGAGLWRAG
jgi:uncharacterized protein YdgA (DUF945 family)